MTKVMLARLIVFTLAGAGFLMGRCVVDLIFRLRREP